MIGAREDLMPKNLPLLILAACVGVGGVELAAQPSGTFRTEINFVEVHAIVTDDDGAFVRDLTKEDFEIYEAGRLQHLTALSFIDVPIERAFRPANRSEPIDWDVRASTPTFEGRVYVLGLDDLHTAPTRSRLVRDAARSFVEQYLGPNDLAAVVYTSGLRESGQELTSSRRLLLAAIDRFQGQKLPPAGVEKLAIHLRNERPFDANEGPSDRTTEGLERAESIRDPYEAERGLNVRRTLESVQKVTTWLADVDGRRKSLLLFSEGFDYDIYEPFTRGVSDSLLFDVQQAVAAAQRANVTVYGIDPRGLSQFGELMDVNARSDYPQLAYGTFRGSLRELLLAQESLISLAEQTGGFAIVNAGDVVGGLGRIVLDNSRYYLLGYHSDLTQWSSDTFLTLEVKVKRPGVQVRARRGFLSPDRKTATREAESDAGSALALSAALGKPLPVGDLSLRVFAAPFKGTGANASVLVALEVDGQDLTFEERDGRFRNTLQVSIVATDERARVQGGDRQTFDLRLLPETYQWIRHTGARLLSRLDVPPGRYQIRVGVHESGGGTVMVPYDLEVPDYSRMAFGMSGLLLTSSEAESFATANPDPQLLKVLASPPVARRRFSTVETLMSFVEVYDDSRQAARQIVLDLTVQDAANGGTIFATRDQRAIDSRGAATQGFSTEIPLKNWRPGIYVLHVRATSITGEHSAERELPFEVTSKPTPGRNP
jgi:VWFA-related protein